MLGGFTSVCGLIGLGTFVSLAAKTVYELEGKGLNGEVKHFEKPLAMTAVMFAGMCFCLPLAYFLERREAEKKAQSAADGVTEPLIVQPGELAPSSGYTGGWRQNLFIAIPTFFDLVATVLMNIGLLYTTASVYQMMRGAEMLFAALFAVVFLKRKLNRFHLGGIVLCVIGISLVGTASTLSGEGSATKKVTQSEIMFGMLLIVMSQAVQAAQLSFEDYFMSDMAVPPLKIVGYEGLFGFIAMALVLMPISQFLPGEDGQGVHEDSLDTLYMLAHNPTILTVVLFDVIALLGLNVSGMCVTGHFGAVFRTVLETTRTLAVWIVGLILFYTPLGGGRLGESWNRYSWIQAVGFVVLVSGTMVYGKGDDKELVEEGLEEEYADTLLPEGSGRLGPEAAAMPISQRMITPAPIPISSSLKATMNISAFSMPSSVGHSYGMRHRGSSGLP